MNVNMLSAAVVTRLRRSALLRRSLPLCLLSLLGILCLFASPRASAQDTRNEARVTIISDLSQPGGKDYVAIRLMNNFDQSVLERIIQTLNTKLNTLPELTVFTKDNVDFPEDKGLGVEFTATIIPRADNYLPIGPFVEAFAPYAKRVRIAYAFKGPITYRGYLGQYSDKDVSFTVTQKHTPTMANPTEVYEMDISISNPALTAVAFQNYPEQGRKPQSTKNLRLYLAAGAAVIILALGLLLALLLPRRKKTGGSVPDEAAKRDVSTGGTHD